MNTTFQLSQKRRFLFNQLFEELKFALSGLTQDELKDIFTDSVKLAARSTYESKKKSIKATGAWLAKTYDRYNKDGVLNSINTDAIKTKDYLLALPQKSQQMYQTFVQLKKQDQTEVIAIIVFTLSIFFVAGGGLDMEGGIPDTDIALGGIGMHRNILSHTILAGLTVEFAARFMIKILDRLHNRLPENHHIVWDRVNAFIEKNKELGIAAMWFGIGAHLLKDSGIIVGNVKPYVGIPGSMPIEAHQGLFAANGVVSSMFGIRA